MSLSYEKQMSNRQRDIEVYELWMSGKKQSDISKIYNKSKSWPRNLLLKLIYFTLKNNNIGNDWKERVEIAEHHIRNRIRIDLKLNEIIVKKSINYDDIINPRIDEINSIIDNTELIHTTKCKKLVRKKLWEIITTKLKT